MSTRAIGRNVHIYDPRDPNTSLGGLFITKGMTNANFHSMVEIIFIFTTDYTLRQKSGKTIQRDDNPLQEGSYFVVASGSFTTNSEHWLTRTDHHPLSTAPPTAEFCNSIRNRDRRCVISGARANHIPREYWGGFDVTHIFPLAHEKDWNILNYGSLISILPESGRSIDSVQNGILLKRDIRSYFESYLVSINPDAFCFGYDDDGIAGTHLSNLEAFLADPQRPHDQLLRWHYRQAVLANVRGQGELLLECHFPPDPDAFGEGIKLEGNGIQLSGHLAGSSNSK